MNTITKIFIGFLCFICFSSFSFEDTKINSRAEHIRKNYSKFEYNIPMRDGKKLFTTVYVPYDTSKKYPFLIKRTPYSVSPYGVDKYSKSLSPSNKFEQDGFIFVQQDVRGQFRSEGQYVNMRPQNAYKKGKNAVDDATDSYDTIEWLINNIPNNNGKAGMWGVSYPGYYTSVASINSHPALKAISPQAPIADWFFDDFHRNGSFVLSMAFAFMDTFDNLPKDKHNHWPKGSDIPLFDGYQFYKDLGPLSNANKKYFNGTRPFWNDLIAHPNYDRFWQERELLQHLGKTKPATLVVGGWYDTEDLYGPLKTYQTMSDNNKKEHIKLVMGPWFHGQWNRKDGSKMGEAEFGFNTSEWFQSKILLPFFQKHLKGVAADIATATVFETGANRWRTFEQWPPKKTTSQTLYFSENETLTSTPQPTKHRFSEFISDPNKPVPHSKKIGRGWDRAYMAEDQRFSARRPDVLTFETEVLKEDLTIAGDFNIALQFSTSQTAADVIVKIIDVFANKDLNKNKFDKEKGNRHELVRWGAIRGRFRDSMSHPKPFEANKVTPIKFELYDVLHTFKRGHKIQIQIQSSMFPFLDRNPQKYVDNIFEAKEDDFIKANHRIYHNDNQLSKVTFNILK